MEFLKRLSTGSAKSSTSSNRSQPSSLSPSSPGFFSKIRACTFPATSPSSPELPDPQVAEQLWSLQRDYEAECRARENAARERVKRKKLMLCSSDRASKIAPTESATPELIASYEEQEISADPEDLASSLNTRPELLSTPTTIKNAADPGLEADLVPTPGLELQGLAATDAHLDSDVASRTSSDLDGSTTPDADPELESVSSTYSDVTCERKCRTGANTAPEPVSTTTTPKIIADLKAHGQSTASVNVQSTKRWSALREELWRSYYSNSRYSRESESGFEPTQTLPPSTEDILYLSLTPIVNTSSLRANADKPTVCAMCSQTLLPPAGACVKNSAWMIHSGARSEAHFLHVECLRSAKTVWGPERGVGACVKCDAFKGVVRGIEKADFEARVMRMEGASFRI